MRRSVPASAAKAAGHGLNNDPVLDRAPYEIPDGGNKQQEPEAVGDKTGRQQQYAGDENHHAMNQFTARHAIGAHFRVDPVKQTDALPSEQKTADNGCQQHHAECRPNPDLAANDYKSRDLGQWHNEQQKRAQGETHGKLSGVRSCLFIQPMTNRMTRPFD